MFELPVKDVHSIVSRMIIKEELLVSRAISMIVGLFLGQLGCLCSTNIMLIPVWCMYNDLLTCTCIMYILGVPG